VILLSAISTQITMTDNISAVLQTISASLNSVNSAFESVYNTTANEIDASGLDHFHSQIQAATEALQEMADIEWVSAQNIDIFSGNDAERFKQEVEAANEMMRQMQFQQEQISVSAQNMRLLPPNALQDISGMGDRIAALRSQIEEVQQSQIEIVGIEQANSETEALRGQLAQALRAQEDMNAALQNMDAAGANRAYQQLNAVVNQTERNIRDNIAQQSNFNTEIQNGARNASGLKKIIAGIVGVFSIKAGIGFLRQSVALTNENIRQEQQLANVMANRGATYEEFIRLQETANRIQADTGDMISSTTMMGAANEFARHVGSIDAIEIMMDSLADFAAGAGNIFGATAQDMAGYAEYFTQAMSGNYRMLERRAGIFLTETQKEVIKYGDDMQRALMIQDIVNTSWAGLAEQMSRTPEGMQAGMINAFNDVRSAIGAQLLPVFMMFFATVRENMPMIEQAIAAIIPIVEAIINVFIWMINIIAAAGNFANEHLGGIENLLWALLIAIVAVKAGMLAWNIITGKLVISKLLLKKALIATGIGALVVAIGLVVLAIMNWIDSVGGFCIAWLIVMNAIKTAWDTTIDGIMWLGGKMMNFFDTVGLAMARVGNGIANVFGGIRVAVLEAIEAMVNGAINMINNIIRGLNRVPFIDIPLIGEATFGQNARANHEADVYRRAQEFYERERAVYENRLAREEAHLQRRAETAENRAARQAEIAYLQAQRLAENEQSYAITHTDFVQMAFDGEGFGSIGRDVSDIAAHTGDMVNISQENLKYWRDIAERDNINRFTTARVTVRVAGITNNVNNEMDLDDVVEYILDGVEEGLETTAERTNDYV